MFNDESLEKLRNSTEDTSLQVIDIYTCISYEPVSLLGLHLLPLFAE
jgi:hypothetical protein